MRLTSAFLFLLSPSDLALTGLLQPLEDELTVEELVRYRALARATLPPKPKKASEKKGWFSWGKEEVGST